MGEFLTDSITELAQSSEIYKIMANETKAFEFTFAQLAESLGEDSFRKYDSERRKYIGGFLISAFEPIALGLGYNFEEYQSSVSTSISNIGEITKSLWSNPEFITGSGVSSPSRIRTNIPLGRRLFAP